MMVLIVVTFHRTKVAERTLMLKNLNYIYLYKIYDFISFIFISFFILSFIIILFWDQSGSDFVYVMLEQRYSNRCGHLSYNTFFVLLFVGKTKPFTIRSFKH